MELQEGKSLDVVPITVTYYRKDTPNAQTDYERMSSFPTYEKCCNNGGWYLPDYTVLELREWFKAHPIASIFNSHYTHQGGIVIHTFWMADVI